MDNAATTFPKPEQTVAAVVNFMKNIGASAGRSGHSLSVESGRTIYDARETVASFFNACDPARVIFTQNATAAINIALCGFLKKGDTAVTSPFEHNSVMRPLRNLAETGIICLQASEKKDNMHIDLCSLREKSKGAKLIAVVHGNNVTGSVTDLKAISIIAKENGCALLIDAAQTAGLIDIDMTALGIDFLCFSGHKGLYGPQGTGALILGENIDHKKMTPLMRGGTGSMSEYEMHPESLPDKFEAGTLNGAGIAGLSAGINWLNRKGVRQNYLHEKYLRDTLFNKLAEIEKVTLYAAPPSETTTNVLSFTMEGLNVSELCTALDERYGIMSRVGLHCAPAVHKALGTFPEGTVRLSVGSFLTIDDVNYTIAAIKDIAECP